MLHIIVVCTACLALLVLVVGTMTGIMLHKIDAELLGATKGIGIGGGLVGLACIAYELAVKGMKDE